MLKGRVFPTFFVGAVSPLHFPRHFSAKRQPFRNAVTACAAVKFESDPAMKQLDF